MRMRANRELAELVRAVLPKPETVPQWKVHVVDSFNEANADTRTKTVRVHRSWRETIYSLGLHHVTRHYPLALMSIEPNEAPVSVVIHRIKLWRAVAIERDYRDGNLTGGLSVGEAYIAQTFDKLGLFADEDVDIAIQKALSERTAKRRQAQEDSNRVRRLRKQLRELVLERSRLYDCGRPVSFYFCCRLLPATATRFLDSFQGACGNGFAPLKVLENTCADALLEIPEANIASLVYELDLIVHAVRENADIEWIKLTTEDEAVLSCFNT
jgi:hypothetical protein